MEPQSSLPCSKQPTICPYLSHLNPLHTISSCFLRSIIILASNLSLTFPNGLLPSGFQLKQCMLAPSPPKMPVSRTSHHRWSDHPDIWWRAQIIKHLCMQLSPVYCYLLLLKPKCLPQRTLPSHTFSLHHTLNIRDEISHPYKITFCSSSGTTTSLFESFGLLSYIMHKTTQNLILPHALIFVFPYSKWKDKRFWTYGRWHILINLLNVILIC